jgi:hypothetical protein
MTPDEGSVIMSKSEEDFMDRPAHCQLLKFLYEELCNEDIDMYCK